MCHTLFIVGASGKVVHILTAENERCRGVHILHGHLPASRHSMYVSRTEHAHAVASAMVLQLLHQTNLSFLLNRFMGRTIFTHTEGIVCPNELHRHFHQGCHTDGGLHIVREDKESTHGRDDTTVEHHTDAHTGHRQL